MKNDAMYMRKLCYFLGQNIRQISFNDIIICWIDGGGWLDRWINGCRGFFFSVCNDSEPLHIELFS